MTINKTDTKKLEDRLMAIANAMGATNYELYSPMVDTHPGNKGWSDQQILDLTPGVIARAYAANEKASQLVTELMQDLRAAERV